ncbi:hypothetical protein DAPPUDRAFT_242052 [Daphnia pulex]|uniref:Uncharacterized protein n=1 Tax=Daphnia pulex TaxID=6669 RepID=E9GFR5_DAPPU|nr:hypothetical protein DAPPUDRAFT_242052 [Daphnia pulex]|eukprot:EFX81682.1 hypothetical protein DAPPUDRAFT_242052 [Daphnia pulex]
MVNLIIMESAQYICHVEVIEGPVSSTHIRKSDLIGALVRFFILNDRTSFSREFQLN